jgi:hypothetical protein
VHAVVAAGFQFILRNEGPRRLCRGTTCRARRCSGGSSDRFPWRSSRTASDLPPRQVPRFRPKPKDCHPAGIRFFKLPLVAQAFVPVSAVVATGPSLRLCSGTTHCAHSCRYRQPFLTPKPPSFRPNTSAEIGVDLETARRVCTHYHKDPPKNIPDCDSDTDQACVSKLVDIDAVKDVTGDLAYFKPNRVPYKNWSPKAIALFRELSLAVVAGTHIQETTDTKATAASEP